MDKFRGTLSAAAAVEAAALGVRDAAPEAECSVIPLADGGEGTLDVLGGANRTSQVTGPLGAPVSASWRLDGVVAVIEMAQASGLELAGGAEGNDPLEATTAGTGQLISAAVSAGARRVIVTLGGSATTDGGLGALEAIRPIEQLTPIEIVAACDVETLFCDAAEVFAPQKGASDAQVKFLTRRLKLLATRYDDEFGRDVTTLVGGGAAGGLGGALG
ncbi:MAG: glycerate kinase, partial [Acidimicrobiales bacterium]